MGPVSISKAKPLQVQGTSARHLMDGLAAHREAKQAHVDQKQRSHKQRQADQMNTFDNGKITRELRINSPAGLRSIHSKASQNGKS